jgi:class I lanthipeptide synthase
MRAAAEGLQPSGFFALRTPLLAFDELRALSDGLQAPSIGEDADADQLERALAADRGVLGERLRTTWRQPHVREAVFVASPELDAALERSPSGGPADHASRSLAAYVARMAGRATPFGLFAGCSTGTLGSRTRLDLAPRSENTRHTRLDMDLLSALVGALEADPAVRQVLRYRPNSSLYRAGGRLHYAECRVESGGRAYHLVAS